MLNPKILAQNVPSTETQQSDNATRMKKPSVKVAVDMVVMNDGDLIFMPRGMPVRDNNAHSVYTMTAEIDLPIRVYALIQELRNIHLDKKKNT